MVGDVSDLDPASDPREEPASRGVPGQVPAVPAGQAHAPIPAVAHDDVIDDAIENPVFITEKLSVSYGTSPAVLDVSLRVPEKQITAFIGPSGCGKSTIIRCFNRMNDLIPAARVEGTVRYHGVDLYGNEIDSVQVRKRIGMVFQKPNPFPKSIYDNIAFGPKVLGMKGSMDQIVEQALRRASLWDDVKDRLKDNAFGMSGGQQQRLCIARALATNPDVLLMDEPCSRPRASPTAPPSSSLTWVPPRRRGSAASLSTARPTGSLPIRTTRAPRSTSPGSSADPVERESARPQFHDQLVLLEEQALGALDIVVEQIDRVMEALENQDVELATFVIADDDRIDGRYLEVHQGILSLLALQAPVAGDLRLVAALLHLIKHAERMGDQCVNIAKLIPIVGSEPPIVPELLDRVLRMGTAARAEVQESRLAFRGRDVELANDLFRQDREVNRLNKEVFQLAVAVGDEVDRREWAMTLTLMARAIERIGDNAVGIGEQVIFVETGLFKEFPTD